MAASGAGSVFGRRPFQKKLEALGIFTIGQLAKAPEPVLYAALKSHGLQIRKYANGIDESEVVTVPPPNKGYGNSLTTPADVTEPETARLYLLSLAETVSARLRADGAMVRTVEVSLRDCHLKNYHHQRQLPAPTDLTGEIYRTACQCFGELWNGVPLRHLESTPAALPELWNASFVCLIRWIMRNAEGRRRLWIF